jgi:ankyrin repeat protein
MSNLSEAAKNGDLETVKKSVLSGAEIHAGDDLALRLAAFYGHFDVVRFLVESGADIHIDNDITLQLASKNRRFDVVKFLIMSGADFKRHQQEMKKLLGVDHLPESKEEIINLLNAAIVINK